MHSIFKTSQSAFTVLRSECTLCEFKVGGVDKDDAVYNDFLTSHAETHSLRSCDQEIFHDPEQFKLHLTNKHLLAMNFPLLRIPFALQGFCGDGLMPWRRIQFLEQYGTKIIMRTLLSFEESVLCSSKQCDYNTQVVGEIQT